MNEADRSEWALLQERQRALESQLKSAAAELEQLRVRIDHFSSPTKVAVVLETSEIRLPEVAPAAMSFAGQTLPALLSVREIPPPQPPPIPPFVPSMFAPVAAPRTAAQVKPLNLHCPGCSQEISLNESLVGTQVGCSYCGKVFTVMGSAVVPEPTVKTPNMATTLTAHRAPPPLHEPAPAPAKESSFEMRLGKFGLVRVGIFLILTGLVFLANLAYQKYIPQLGPAGKVTLLYLASGLLLGAGAWLQRNQKKESLKNYAQVLFAGGLAAVFFTTYAAHHITNLIVIESAVMDGLLLLGWTGFIVWLADRQKSEVLALFAIGLAYYTAIITDIGLFTLYANLVLTVAAVFFLVRNRWATVSFASLAATYVGFAFWRFIHQGDWRWDQRTEELFLGNVFLTGYWILFTAAAFLSRSEKLSGVPRALFASLNNGAYFALVILSMLHVNHGNFWKFSLGFGAVLLGLALLARRALADEAELRNAYLTQGLLWVTVGFIAYFTGLKLALVLAAESVVLSRLARARNNSLLRAGAFITAALAVAWGFAGMKKEMAELWLGTAVGALLIFNACGTRRHAAPPNESSGFAALALLMWLVTTWVNCPPEWLGPVLACEAVLFTGSFYLLKVRALTLFGQGYLVLAQIFWLVETLSTNPGRPWWNPAVIITATLVISHWWQRQTALDTNRETRNHFQAVFALAVVGILFFWLHPTFDPAVWLAFTSLLAVGITLYGLVTRAWFLAVCGQFFLIVSGWEFVRQLLTGKPEWYFALAPLAALLTLAFVAASWFERQADTKTETGETVLQVGQLYRWVAVAMSIWWVLEYIPAPEQCWVLSLTGALVFLVAGWRRQAEGLLQSAVFFATELGLFLCLPARDLASVSWPNLLAILVLPALQQLARRRPDRFALPPEFHAALILPGGAWLWLYLSRGVVLAAAGNFYLTASWAALALVIFAAGFGLRERLYRWLGLFILAGALGRIVLLDVWRLELLYRVLSFMALGIVLLVLGYIYNRYEEKIKLWL